VHTTSNDQLFFFFLHCFTLFFVEVPMTLLTKVMKLVALLPHYIFSCLYSSALWYLKWKKTLESFGKRSLRVLSSFPFLFRVSKSSKGMWETNSFLHWETKQTLQVGVVTFVWYVWAHWPWSLFGCLLGGSSYHNLLPFTSWPTTSNQGIRIIPTLYALHYYLPLSKLVECMGVHTIKQRAQVMC